jgi:hypothetical protein
MDYWLSKTSGERIAALEELRRTTYRFIHGHEMPPMSKTAKILKRGYE